MPQDYTIAQVVKNETFPGSSGDTMRAVELQLEGVNHTVKSYGLAKFDPPQQGETIFGEINGQKFIFKKRGEQTSTDNGGAPAARTDDPQRRSIERQVAAKIAGELLAVRPVPATQAAFAEDFRFLTDTIYDAIRG